MEEPCKRTAPPREVPTLTAEEEAFLSAISAPKNKHFFSLEAVSKAYANTKRLRPAMTPLEREYLTLWIANDLSARLVQEMPEQSEALKALTAEIECACARWLSGGIRSTNMTDASKLRKVPKLTQGQIALHGGISENARLFSLAAAVKAMRPDMTEPHQRTRALLETNQFLYELQDPKLMPRVPAAVRKLAGKLLQHYPSYADIELVHKKLPLIFGPSPPFSGAYVRTAITELGLDKIGSKG